MISACAIFRGDSTNSQLIHSLSAKYLFFKFDTPFKGHSLTAFITDLDHLLSVSREAEIVGPAETYTTRSEILYMPKSSGMIRAITHPLTAPPNQPAYPLHPHHSYQGHKWCAHHVALGVDSSSRDWSWVPWFWETRGRLAILVHSHPWWLRSRSTDDRLHPGYRLEKSVFDLQHLC